MKKNLILIFSLAFIFLSCTYEEIKTLPQSSEVIYPDSAPPIIIPDPELGEGNCETDRDWKFRDLIEDFQIHFTNLITIDQVGSPNWKIGTPDDVLLGYRNKYNRYYKIMITVKRIMENKQ